MKHYNNKILFLLVGLSFLFVESYASRLDSIRQDFVSNLQEQPINSLPFSFAEYVFDSLEDKKIQYEKELRKLTYFDDNNSIFDSDSISSMFRIDSTSHQNFATNDHYYFLTNYDCSCYFSKPIFFRRLPSYQDTVEVFLTLTKIVEVRDQNQEHIRGIIITINLFNIQTETILDKLHLITAGIGGEDITYYDAFTISQEFTIVTFSSYSLEDRLTQSKHKFYINKQNNISEYEKIVRNVYWSEDEDYED